MPKQKKGIILSKLVIILFGVVLGVCLSTSYVKADDECENFESDTYIYLDCDTTWHKNDDLNWHRAVFVDPGVTLTIEKGAHIKFGKDVNGQGTYLSIFGGQLLATGTQDEPITITAEDGNESSLLEFHNEIWEDIPAVGPSFLRYVEIYEGGYKYDDSGAYQVFWRNFINPVYAETRGAPAVLYNGGKVHFENCTFRDNKNTDVGVLYDEFASGTGMNNYLEIVNSNFAKSGESYALKSEVYCKEVGGNCQKKIFLKNNWYDSNAGPSGDFSGSSTNGKKISGTFYLDGWKHNDLIVDPVIVVPGILGSAPQTSLGGNLVLDPILHIYDNLILSFEENGYEKNKNLFEFPYEWRDSNVQTADLLQQKITEVRKVSEDTKISKVDLVAHSMGGLVARYYIESPGYQNDVDQLITLGTPHHGAPESYLEWEAGEAGVKIEDYLLKKIFQIESFHSGYIHLNDYMHDKVKSIGELLPDYNYLFDVTGDYMKKYPYVFARNIFLDDLNTADKISNLDNVDFYNIIGNTAIKETISGFRVVDSDKIGLWLDGMPENYYMNLTDHGIVYDEGDKTVPLYSSDVDYADKKDEINSTHASLPTKAQCDVIDRLTGKNSCADNYVDTVKRITNILTFGVFSPIDLQVIAPDGVHWAGKNIKNLPVGNKIEGAYYTGYDGVVNEFLTIPNLDGEYTIVTEGTDNGDYTVRVSKISEDGGNLGQAKESSLDIVGMAVKNKIIEAAVVVSGDKVILPEVYEMTPAIFRDNVEKYYRDGLIKNKQARNVLLSGMKLIEEENRLLKMIEANPFIDRRTKKVLIALIERQIENQFKAMIKTIQKDKKNYAPAIKDVLIEDLKFIKESL